jgi:NB-ARC domain
MYLKPQQQSVTMRSLKSSPNGLKQIKEAREKRELAIDKDEWLEEASNFIPPIKNGKSVVPGTVSIGTWKRFLQGKPVKPVYFRAFCQVLKLDWEEVVETQDEVQSAKNKGELLPISRHDWDGAPNVSIFYDRSRERNQLKQWLIDDKCRLVSILGLGGVGKSALAVKLAQEVSGEFDYVIWRSLREAPRVEKIILDVVRLLSQQQEVELPESLGDKITRFIHYLKTSRCLLILDNGESILQGGISTGCYLQGYAGYGELFRRVGDSEHQSCLLLTSREQFREVRRLAGDISPVKVWELGGLDSATEILTARGITGSAADIKALVKHYHGNPLALQIVPATIKKLFNGNIF